MPAYDDDDVFLLGGGDDLVHTLDDTGQPMVDTTAVPGYRIERYRPRVEGAFIRIERWTRLTDGDIHWRAISGENVLSIFGRTVADRICDPGDPLRVFQWLLSETRDPFGNAVVYEYVPEDTAGVDLAAPHESGSRDRTAQRYLKRVLYGNQTPLLDSQGRRPVDLTEVQRATAGWLFEVVLDYGDHDSLAPAPQPDRPWTCRPDPFSVYKSGFEVRNYRLCRRTLMFHHFPLEPGVGANCLVAALELDYSTDRLSLLTTVTYRGYARRDTGGYDSAALPPMCLDYRPSAIDPTVHEIAQEQLEGVPTGFTATPYQWVDLTGEGMAGFLTEHRNTWFYKPNLGGGRFGPLVAVDSRPSAAALSAGRQALVDITGDGRADLVQLVGPGSGFAENTDGQGFEDFTPFEFVPIGDLAGADVQLVDLTGDGCPDLLLTADDALIWYRSLGVKGFATALRIALPADEESGPRLVRADTQQAVFLGDMSGDGQADLVRVSHAEICYWPSLGRGHFGARIVMSKCPDLDSADAFDARRVRLADVDGSGTSDLIYVGARGASLFFNESGNSWSEPTDLPPFPHIDDLSIVKVADLLGTGTACLVWSTPNAPDSPLRYIDLMPGGPPRLLVGMTNSMGAETRVRYTPSTFYMVADRDAGRPWLTRLPFPVQVVSDLEVLDHVSGSRLTSHYAYRNGYFDALEREYRGFASVERSDTEAFTDYATGVAASDGTQDTTPELFQPPVLTRSWFHTGAFLDQADLAIALRAEYFQQRQDLPDSEFPEGLSTSEYRACVRALKGSLLRTETFSPDGSPDAASPYLVTEHRFELRRVQPGVVQPLVIEDLETHYERDAADARVIHGMVLDTDDFGRPTATASIAYGRHTIDPALPADVTADQRRTWVTVQRTTEAPEIDRSDSAPAYRLPAPWETRSWELTGVTPARARYSREEIGAALVAATDVEFSAEPSPAMMCRRLTGWSRVQFRGDAAEPLPFGQQGSLGLIERGYRLAFPQRVADTYYGAAISEGEWSEAGYVTLEGLTGRWIPTATFDYSSNPATHFYLPDGATDPFDVTTTITRDNYDLLAQRTNTIGAAWRTSSVVNDYRVLRPVQFTDVNGNRSAVSYDSLGFVVRSALMGKEGAGEGDTLEDPTVILEYDLTRWATYGTPNVIHIQAREQFGSANAGWRETYQYANGTGGVAEVKAQAPGGWLVNGRTIWNNKGNPVKQYEPFHSAISDYDSIEALALVGVTPVMFYDPMSRLIRVDLPNGTMSRVVFTPWRRVSSDPNDTVLDSRWYAERGSPDPNGPEPADSEERAAWLSAKHARTPSITHSDSLGRTILAVSDLGGGATSTVRSKSDLTGARTSLVDPLGRDVSAGFASMVGAPIFARTAERGSRWMFVDIEGAPVRTWDGRGRVFVNRFDNLRRPVATTVQDGDFPELFLSYTVYGDRKSDALARNLNGVVHQVFDGAGMMSVDSVDFVGVPVSVTRVLASDPTSQPDWTPLNAAADYLAVQTAAAALLDAGDTYTASSTHDALGRTLTLTLSDGTVLLPAYDQACRLDSLKVRIAGTGSDTIFLAQQTFNAKGQRLTSRHGNGVSMTFGYDRETFRLVDLTTVATGADPDTQALQKLRYTYDPVGNIVRAADEAQQKHFFANAVVTPEATYEYDPAYRLVTAAGRELVAGNDAVRTWDDVPTSTPVPHANDLNAVRRYTEHYEYDLCGNIVTLRHVAPVTGGSWTRHYRYRYQDDSNDPTNRLAATSGPGDPDGGPYTHTYDYDSNGNFSRLNSPTPGELTWNTLDQLQQVDLGGGGTAYYAYGADGSRVRKVIDRPGGLRKERIYLGPLEIYRERQAGAEPSLVRNTLEIGDDTGRIAQVDTKIRDTYGADLANPLGVPVIRYQYGNHLGSATLETDDVANVVGYEEYHPYGTTAYHSSKSSAGVSLKRYRFAAREHDDETGLYYCGARYYAPWLGRWTSPDPDGFVDGVNLWQYCRGNPIIFRDPEGRQSRVTVPGTRDDALTARSTFDERVAFAARHGYRLSDPNPQAERWNPEQGGWLLSPEGRLERIRPGQSGGEGDGAGGSDAPPTVHSPAGGAAEARTGGGGSEQLDNGPSGEPTHDIGLTSSPSGGRQVAQELARPESTAGARPRGTLHLWSGPEGKQEAKTSIANEGEGWMMGDIDGHPTPQHAAGEAEFARARAAAPGGQLTQAEFEHIWGPRSAEVVGRGAFAGHPVEAHGTPRPGSIQPKYEWPARSVGGGIGGGLAFGTGMFTAISGGQDPNPNVAIPLILSGVGEATSGLIFAAGAVTGATEAMAIGSAGATAFGGAGAAIGFGVASYRSFERGDTAGGVINALGAIGGVLMVLSLFTPVGWVGLVGVGLVALASGFNLGRWLSR